ncbi:MAG: class I SAM-dependent methyltransferase [Phycisphaerae bacterium]|nr:class I SAM-dependent methyltransferase [Phycisphaerae bacterium]
MKRVEGIDLGSVQAVYTGSEWRLWELLMGEQIHIGGLVSSQELARKAGIATGMAGTDLCCCTGAGMRFLVRFCQVRRMVGVDATETVVRRGEQRCRDEGMEHRIRFVLGDACETGLESASVDFVWGEDAWCYVADKAALLAEAARLVKGGGLIAFTDWIEGSPPMSDAEADRFLRFMKFPSVQDLGGYRGLLESCGCAVVTAEDTGRFAPHAELYVQMLSTQLRYDALKIIGFDSATMEGLMGELRFVRDLARTGKIAQGLFVARKAR